MVPSPAAAKRFVFTHVHIRICYIVNTEPCPCRSIFATRDPRAAELAKELAARRKITMTAAIIEALQNEIKRERDKVPLRERLAQLALTARALAGRNGRAVPRSQIDDMWSR